MAEPNSSFSGAPPTKHDVLLAQPLVLQGLDDDLHVRHGRRQQRRHPQDVGLVLVQRSQERLGVGVDPEVDHLEAGALQHHRHQVLADVVDVALHRPDHDLADRLGPGLGQQRTQDGHPRLHGVGRQQDLGHEEDAIAEVDAHDAHPLDQGLVEHPSGRPAPLQQDGRALVDLVGQAVVQVVVHLGRELWVTQAPEVQLFILGHGLTPVTAIDGSDRRIDPVPVRSGSGPTGGMVPECGTDRALLSLRRVPRRSMFGRVYSRDECSGNCRREGPTGTDAGPDSRGEEGPP